MASPGKPTIAIFGATAGTGLLALKSCLAAGHKVNALARTPSKLSSLQSQYPDILNVVPGDIHKPESIKVALVLDSRPVDIVISTIGMALHMEGIKVASPDHTICEVGTRNIIEKLSELETEYKGAAASLPAASKTKLVILSTTGISKKRDVPLAVVPFYHWGLAIPHKDKMKMEQVVTSSSFPFVLVRPSFLLDGTGKGLAGIRTGTETPTEDTKPAHAVGYVIKREDVALWIYEECVSERAHWSKWNGKCVSLTY